VRCDYQQESIKVANLASVKNGGSDLKQITWPDCDFGLVFSQNKNGKCLVLQQSFSLPPVKLDIFSFCKGDPENDCAGAGYSQDANMLWRS